MFDSVGWWGAGAPSDTILFVLTAAVAVLFALTCVFSAYAIALRVGHELRERRWARLRGRWREAVLAALADPAAEAAVHAVVEERYRRHFVQFVLEYARRVRGAERATLRRLAAPYLHLIGPRTRHRRAEVRTRAVQTLGMLGLPTHAEAVVSALDDPSPLASMVAARYLARPEFAEFAHPVLAHVHRFEGWNPRFLASMLGAIGPEVSGRLREGLADEDRPTWVRAVFGEALSLQRDPLAGDPAAAVLPTSEDRELLAACLRILVAVGRPEHADAVRPLAASPDTVLRAYALSALGVLGGPGDLPLFERALDDPSPWIALHAARAVRDVGRPDRLAGLASAGGRRELLAGQVLREEET